MNAPEKEFGGLLFVSKLTYPVQVIPGDLQRIFYKGLDFFGHETGTQPAEYSKSVRNHARVVILALFVALIGTATFAVNRLFTSSATPESAVTAAADFVAKQTNLTTDRIHFTGMAAENDAYVVTYSVPMIGNDFTVRVAKKDGTVTQVTPQKKP